MERLDQYVALEREKLEIKSKIPPKKSKTDQKDESEYVQRRISTTNPEAGFLKRPHKPNGMHYLAHQSLDSKYGIIVDMVVTPGNLTDATPYLDRVQYMR